MSSIGIAPRVCKSYTPQTKGKVERSVGIIKHNFWPGVHFTNIDDLNEQARVWCDGLNQRVHGTTRKVPVQRWREECLLPFPETYTWERFGTEERKVSWDGYISYDGVHYGLPGDAKVAGTVVLVRERRLELRVFSGGQLVATLPKRPCSQEIVTHPHQFRMVAPVATVKQSAQPVGHQITPPQVTVRSLAEYDRLFGVKGIK
jgi:hypothetical protein